MVVCFLFFLSFFLFIFPLPSPLLFLFCFCFVVVVAVVVLFCLFVVFCLFVCLLLLLFCCCLFLSVCLSALSGSVCWLLHAWCHSVVCVYRMTCLIQTTCKIARLQNCTPCWNTAEQTSWKMSTSPSTTSPTGCNSKSQRYPS